MASPEPVAAGDRLATLDGARIGFLVDRWSPKRGGAEAALQSLACKLANAGADLQIFAQHADLDQLPARASWHPVKSRGLLRSQRERCLERNLVASAHAAACDLTIGVRHLSAVDLYWPHGGSYGVALAARRLSRGQSPPSKCRGRHRVFLDLERALFEGSKLQRVVCVSKLVEQEFRRTYPSCSSSFLTIPNGVDLEKFHPRERLIADGRGKQLREQLGLGEQTSLLLFSAREPQLKGLPALLRALAACSDLPLHLVVAGVRRAARWQRRVKALHLTERVSFIPNGDPVALSAAADLCVLPTWRDTSSLVVLECLAAGTPVITTERCGASTLIASPAAGAVLADPADVKALEDAIRDQLRPGSLSPIDRREQVRETVKGLSQSDWLEALAAEVAALLRAKP